VGTEAIGGSFFVGLLLSMIQSMLAIAWLVGDQA
jgi:hypothetical protein